MTRRVAGWRRSLGRALRFEGTASVGAKPRLMQLRRWAEAVTSRCGSLARVRLALLNRRVAVVVRIEAGERLASGLVIAAALVGASVLCAAGTPPRLGGLSVFGAVMLAAGLIGLVRLLSSS